MIGSTFSSETIAPRFRVVWSLCVGLRAGSAGAGRVAGRDAQRLSVHGDYRLGLYFPYVAIHATVFERLMAMNRDRGNIAYLMYLAMRLATSVMWA